MREKKSIKILKKLLCSILVFSMVASNVMIIKAEDENKNNDTKERMNVQMGTKNNIIAGYSDSYYLDKEGEVWQWGLENNSKIPKSMLKNVKYISTSGDHTMAIKNDKTLWGWGANNDGEVGTGNLSKVYTPKQIMNNVEKVYTGYKTTMAIKSDKSLWMWGYTYNGNFGAVSPKQITTNVVDVVNTGISTLILKSDRTLWQVGYTYYEGRGSSKNEYTTNLVKIADNVRTVFGSTYGGFIIKNDKTLWAWGDNYWGQLGDNSKTTRRKPVYITDNVEVVDSMMSSTYALKTDGTLWAWGDNSDGELGNGNRVSSLKPIQIETNIKDFKVNGGGSFYALKKNGDLVGWGGNYDGCLGNGSTSIVLKPVRIATNVKSIKPLTTSHRAILKNDDSLHMWGDNSYGQVGINSTSSKVRTPSLVSSNVDKVSTNGYHTLAIKKDGNPWAWGDNRFGQVGNSSNKYIRTPISISTKISTVDGENIDLGSIPSVPVQGLAFMKDVNIGVDIPIINTSIQLNRRENTFQCIIGIPNKDIQADAFDSYYSQMSSLVSDYNKYKQTGNLSDFKIPNNDLGKIIGLNSKGTAIFGSNSPNLNIDFFGVVEGSLDGVNITNGSVIATTELMDILSLKKIALVPVFGVPIPFLLQIGANIEANTDLKVSGKDKFSGDFNLAPNLKIEGGVGIKDGFYVGPYGKMILDMNLNNPNYYHNITAKGKIGIEIDALSYGTEYEWFEDGRGEWEWANTYPNSKNNNYNESKIKNENNSQELKLISRDYLKDGYKWNGSRLKRNTIMPTNSNNLQSSTVAENIFSNSQPMLAEVNGNKIMVWHHDNENRTSINRTELVFSIYNNRLGTWSNPKSVNNDGTADFYYDIFSDGNDLFIAWQNSKKVFNSDNTSIKDVFAESEIYVSKFNTIKNEFGIPVVLTNNSTLDGMPNISAKDGKIVVSWTRNSENDILGIIGKDTLVLSYFDNGVWTTKELDEGKIISNSVVHDGNKGYIIFEKDLDNNLQTIDDRDIYYKTIDSKSIGSSIKLTNNKVKDSNPKAFVENGKVSILYYSNNNIRYIKDIGSVKPGSIPSSISLFEKDSDKLTGNFNIIKNHDSSKIGIIWTEDKEGVVEGYVSTFNKNTSKLSDPIKLTYDDQRIKHLNGIYGSDGNISVVYNKANKIKQTAGGVEYYKNGNSDLCISNIVPTDNLSIDESSVYFDEKSLASDGYIDIKFNVTNNGYNEVDKFIIKAYDGKPGTNGSFKMKEQTIYKKLKQGQTEEVIFRLNIYDSTDVYLDLETVSGQDFDMDNNRVNIKIGHEDLEIARFEEVNSKDNNINLQVEVKNQGVKTSRSSTITLREGSPEGKVIASKELSWIYSLDKEVVEFKLDKGNISFKDNNALIYATIESPNEEKILGNNSSFISVKDLSNIKPSNNAPMLQASDVTIKLGDKFDVKKYASASDEEDGYISSNIQVTSNTVNTSKLGTYKVTYKIVDSQGLSATKTINVKVNNVFIDFTVNSVDSKSTEITGKGILGATVKAYVGSSQIGNTVTVSSAGSYKITIPAKNANTTITVKMSKSGYATSEKSIKVIGIATGAARKLTNDIYRYDADKGNYLTYVNGKGYSQYSYLNKGGDYAFTPSSWMKAAGLSVSMPKSSNGYTMTIDNGYIGLYNDSKSLLDKIKAGTIVKSDIKEELNKIQGEEKVISSGNYAIIQTLDTKLEEDSIQSRATPKKTLRNDIYRYDLGKGKHLTYINGKGYSQYSYLNKSGDYAFTPSSWMKAAGLTVTMPTSKNGYTMKVDNSYITKYNNTVKEIKKYI